MLWTAPNILTLLRIALIPIFIFVYGLSAAWATTAAMALFILAALTDWLDGYLARRLDQISPFGAFLDPVADKLMVVSALVLLAADERIHRAVFDAHWFEVIVLIIIGRELAVSALREWMAELGERARVAVSMVGKLKTTSQMVAIPFLLYQKPILGYSVIRIGEFLLFLAAALTLWSMLVYLRAAWPSLTQSGKGRKTP